MSLEIRLNQIRKHSFLPIPRKNACAVNLFQKWKTEFLLFVKPTADESTKYIAQLSNTCTSYLSDNNNDDLEKVLRFFFHSTQ